jgi:hypothetical protein
MKYTLEIQNVKSRIIEDLPEDITRALYNKLSAEVVGSYYARQASPFWDGKSTSSPKSGRLL